MEKTVAFIVRHGSTRLNDENKYRGQLDVPLDERGKREAKEVAEFLKNQPIGQAWTSDLRRAKDTAKEILKGRGLKAIPTEKLRPLDSGKFAGKSKDEYKEQMEYYHEHPEEKIPGGESINGANNRMRKPLLKAFRAGLRGKPSLVSAHASVIHSAGHLLHNNHKAALVKPGGAVKVIYDGEKFKARPIFKAKMEDEKHYAS
ncbi:MAG TPA: histidine phosphatase family protein [Candidatus Paceibacterota bacterium]|jgi:broad specificity phosphatase PhoE|nr:histidine phosphatase family protein [Candidatus Paceibacterota bacterium]